MTGEFLFICYVIPLTSDYMAVGMLLYGSTGVLRDARTKFAAKISYRPPPPIYFAGSTAGCCDNSHVILTPPVSTTIVTTCSNHHL